MLKMIKKKRFIALLLSIIIIVFAASGAIWYFYGRPAVPPGLTPTETVEQYLKYSKYQRKGAMASLIFMEYNQNLEIRLLNSEGRVVNIVEVTEDKDSSRATHESISAYNPYDVTYVKTFYQVAARGGPVSRNEFFYLIKLTEDAPWLIYDWGYGP